MPNVRMRRFTGICALATVLLWLAIFPLYTFGPLGSLYDGAALAGEFFRIHNIVFTRIQWVDCLHHDRGLHGRSRVCHPGYRHLASIDWLACLCCVGAVPRVHPGDVRGASRPNPFLQRRWLGRRHYRQFSPVPLVPRGRHPADLEAPDICDRECRLTSA
jgi:hypothetical protein